MKTITMTEFRASPGERVMDVYRDGETRTITKAGKAVGTLAPIDDTIEILPDGRVKGWPLLSAGPWRTGGGY